MRRETLPVKAHFNHWLKTLPKILKPQARKLDNYANFFFYDIFERFLIPEKMLYNVSPHWAVINFLKIFEALLSDFRSNHYLDTKRIDNIIEKFERRKINPKPTSQLSTRNMKNANSMQKSTEISRMKTSVEKPFGSMQIMSMDFGGFKNLDASRVSVQK